MQYFRFLYMSPLLLPLCIKIYTTVRKTLDILLVVEFLKYSKNYFFIQQNKNYSSIYKSIIITSLIGFNIALQQYSFIASIQLTSKQRCNNVDTALCKQHCFDIVSTSATNVVSTWCKVENLTSYFVSFQRRINDISMLIHNVEATLIRRRK